MPVNPNTKNLAGLVADLNAARLLTAGLGSAVVASASSFAYITLTAAGPAPASSIMVQVIGAGAANLGFTNGQTSGVALRLDLDYEIAKYSGMFTPALNIPGSDSLAVSASTTLNLSAWATFQLSLGISLTGNDSFTPFLYDFNPATGQGTGLILDAMASANPLNAKADLGPLSVSVTNGFAVINSDGKNDSTAPAQLVIGLQSPATGTPPSNLPGRHTLTDPILPDLGVVQATAFAGADLPIYYAIGDGTPKEIYDLRLTANLTQPLSSLEFSNGLPGGVSLEDAINNALNGASVSDLLRGLSAGVDAVFGPLFNGIDGQVLGSNLPLIGSGIATAASFLGQLESSLVTALNTAADTLDQIETQIYNIFGPGPLGGPAGLNWLQPIPGNTKTGPAASTSSTKRP